MTKLEIVNLVAKEIGGITNKDTLAVVDSIISSITDALSHGEKVQIMGFGTFETRTRAAYKAHDPRNFAKIIDVPEKTVPVFSAGKTLKDAINTTL